jgi:dihydrofolate reductase
MMEVPMSKVVVSTFVTVDGVMEDPGGSEGFKHGGWQLPFFDQDLAAGVREELFVADALLLGRVTYQHFAAAWPSMTDDDGFADRMNSLPKFVASTTLQEPLAWNATLLKGDVAEAVAELKRSPGQNILVQGSSELARTLLRHGLVDEYRLRVHPVVVGSGKRLFNDGIPPTTLRLVDTQVTSTGVVGLTYQPAQEAKGSAPHQQ